MTQENKELLLQDLCARLPYNVKVDITYSKEHGSSDRLRMCSEGCLTLNTDVLGLYVQDEIYLKPYLRPMSSMTGEEYIEFQQLDTECGKMPTFDYVSVEHYRLFDWLNKHHFDYRDLIPKGLAIAITESNNSYKTLKT